jgi:hypothetical protein
MPYRFVFMLVFGVVLFVVGALTRAYMNIVISRSPLSSSSGVRSTELRYKRLIREQGARVWPLVVTIVFIPLGILIAFAAVIWNNLATSR